MDSDDHSALFSFDVPSTKALKIVSKLTPKKRNPPKSKSRKKHSPLKASKNGTNGGAKTATATKAGVKAGATKWGSSAKITAGGSPKKGVAKVSSKTSPRRPRAPKRPHISGIIISLHNFFD